MNIVNDFARDLLSSLPAFGQAASSTQPMTKTSSALRADYLDSTIYVADLPLTVTYRELIEVFERQIGTCEIVIKRSLFKNFHYAYVSFKDASLGKPNNELTLNSQESSRCPSLSGYQGLRVQGPSLLFEICQIAVEEWRVCRRQRHQYICEGFQQVSVVAQRPLQGLLVLRENP